MTPSTPPSTRARSRRSDPPRNPDGATGPDRSPDAGGPSDDGAPGGDESTDVDDRTGPDGLPDVGGTSDVDPAETAFSRRAALAAGAGGLLALAGCAALRGGTPTPADPEPLGGPWPTDGAVPRRTNAAPEASLPDEDARGTELLAESSRATGGVRDGPVVAGGTAFAGARTGHLLARGRHEWTVELETAVYGSPTVHDGRVYAVTGATLVAFDARTGERLWRAEDDAAGAGLHDPAPTAVDGTVYVGSEVLAAYDARTGERRWVARLGPDGPAIDGIAVTPGVVVAVSPGVAGREAEPGHLAAFEPDGTKRWRVRPAPVDHGLAGPVVADGRVLVATDRGRLFAIDAGSGTTEWTVPVDADLRTGLAVAGGTVFVPGGADGTLRALDAADGSERWTREVGFCADAPAVVDDRVAVVGDEPPGTDGLGMAVLDAETGEPVGSFGAVDGEFAVGDGWVACRRESSLWSVG